MKVEVEAQERGGGAVGEVQRRDSGAGSELGRSFGFQDPPHPA